MEVSAQELALADARSRLTLARTEMHTFEPSQVTPVIADGLKIVASSSGGRTGHRRTAAIGAQAWSFRSARFFSSWSRLV